MKNSNQVIIYTDGACSGNPGPGGWGALLIYNGHEREIYGGEQHTTNNRMELLAAIKALEALKRPVSVDLYTDSTYVRDGVKKWVPVWQKNNWRTSDKKLVKNIDLWKRLVLATQNHEIRWHWVRGHSGDANNERVDELARRGIYTTSE